MVTNPLQNNSWAIYWIESHVIFRCRLRLSIIWFYVVAPERLVDIHSVRFKWLGIIQMQKWWKGVEFRLFVTSAHFQYWRKQLTRSIWCWLFWLFVWVCRAIYMLSIFMFTQCVMPLSDASWWRRMCHVMSCHLHLTLSLFRF